MPHCFAVSLEAQTVAPAEVPKITRGWVFHFLIAGDAAVFGIRRKPGALVIIRRHRGVAPTVAIGADFAVAIEVIQQDIIAGELMSD